MSIIHGTNVTMYQLDSIFLFRLSVISFPLFDIDGTCYQIYYNAKQKSQRLVTFNLCILYSFRHRCTLVLFLSLLSFSSHLEHAQLQFALAMTRQTRPYSARLSRCHSSLYYHMTFSLCFFSAVFLLRSFSLFYQLRSFRLKDKE